MVCQLCFFCFWESWLCPAQDGLVACNVSDIKDCKGAQACGCIWDMVSEPEKDCACRLGGKG